MLSIYSKEWHVVLITIQSVLKLQYLTNKSIFLIGFIFFILCDIIFDKKRKISLSNRNLPLPLSSVGPKNTKQEILRRNIQRVSALSYRESIINHSVKWRVSAFGSDKVNHSVKHTSIQAIVLKCEMKNTSHSARGHL